MIIQQRDALGRINVLGFGTILAPKGEPVAIYTKVNDTAKGTFTITTNVAKNKDGLKKKYAYQNIPCAVYGKQHNKEIFATLETLNPKDKVLFGGIYYEHKAYDTVTKKEVDYSEVRLEFLLPYSPLLALLLGDTKVRKLKNDHDQEVAVKCATNKAKREKKYKF